MRHYSPPVPVYVALLRAVNLGARRRVPMGDLRALLGDAGYDDVRTHIQSGNALLAAPRQRPAALEEALERTLAKRFGFDIDVMVRSASDLKRIIGANPFDGRDADCKALHVAFLKARPAAAAVRALDDRDFGRDEYVLSGAEIYLRYPHGLGRSKMTAGLFERALATPATVRRFNVVKKLYELASS